MTIYTQCPHCYGAIEIIEINCAIFRHGIYKNNNEQLHPHASKSLCDHVFENNLIYGCGKPFKLINDNGNYKAIKCDYI